MKILYVANSDLPTKAAGSVNIMKMCDALSKNGHEVILIFPNFKKIKETDENICNYYGLKNKIKLKQLNYIGKNIYLVNMFMSFYSYYISKRYMIDIVYGRNLLSCVVNALFRNKVIYEIHEPISNLGIISKIIY